MIAIKSHTDLGQSRKLAEFLPLESADMCYRYYSGSMITGYGDCVLAKSYITGKNVIRENDLPCWSLASLLAVLPDYTLQTNTDGTVFVVCDSKKPMISDSFSNPVDACYEMIIKLHELKKL